MESALSMKTWFPVSSVYSPLFLGYAAILAYRTHRARDLADVPIGDGTAQAVLYNASSESGDISRRVKLRQAMALSRRFTAESTFLQRAPLALSLLMLLEQGQWMRLSRLHWTAVALLASTIFEAESQSKADDTVKSPGRVVSHLVMIGSSLVAAVRNWRQATEMLFS